MFRSISLCLIIASLLFAGCGSRTAAKSHVLAPYPAGKDRMLVLPLANLTQQPRAGIIVADLLRSELTAVSGLVVLEPALPAERLGVVPEDIHETARALTQAKAVRADTVLFGTVFEYGYKRGMDQGPAVAVNVRLVDVFSGAVIWTGSVARTAGGGVVEDSAGLLAVEVCHELVSRFIGMRTDPGKAD